MLNRFFPKKLSTSRILNDLKENSDNKQIYFKEFTHNNSNIILPRVIELRVMYNGNFFKAYGHGKNIEGAAFKATMELIERIGLVSSKENNTFHRFSDKKRVTLSEIQKNYPKARNWLSNSSSGVAIHQTEGDALHSSLSELIERHVILKALLLEISPLTAKAPKVMGSFNIPSKWNIDFFYWRGPLNYKVTVARIKLGSSQYFGLGCSTHLEKSLTKSFYELSGRLYRYLNKELNRNIPNLINDENTHMLFHENMVSDKLENILTSNAKKEGEIDISEIKREDIFYQTLEVPKVIKQRDRLKLIRMTSPRMQALFKGTWELDKLNPNAYNLIPSKLPSFMHIIG